MDFIKQVPRMEIFLPAEVCVSTRPDGRLSRDMGRMFKLKLILVRVLVATLPRLDSARV